MKIRTLIGLFFYFFSMSTYSLENSLEFSVFYNNFKNKEKVFGDVYKKYDDTSFRVLTESTFKKDGIKLFLGLEEDFYGESKGFSLSASELWLSYKYNPNFDFGFGKKKYNWNKGDVLNFTDYVTPLNNELLGVYETSDVNKGFRSVFASFSHDSYSIDLIIPLKKSFSNPVSTIANSRRIYHGSREEFGLRIVKRSKIFDLDIYAYDSYSKNGTYNFFDKSINHTKQKVYGINFEKVLDNFVINTGLTITDNNYLFENNKNRLDKFLSVEYYGLETGVIGLEYVYRGMRESSEIFLQEDFLSSHELAFKYSATFFNDSLENVSTLYYFKNDMSKANIFRQVLKYSFNDSLSLEAKGVFIDGDGNNLEFLNDNDHFSLGVIYNY